MKSRGDSAFLFSTETLVFHTMKNSKNTVFYLCVTGVFSVFIFSFLKAGRKLEEGLMFTPTSSVDHDYLTFLSQNIQHPLPILLLQIVFIVGVAKVFGILCKKIGQPAVVGEMVAGILLGPSLFGLFFPQTSDFLFPISSLSNLQVISQVGLVFFMFVVGLELDLKTLKSTTKDAIVISHASIVIPFSLGVGLSYFLYVDYAPSTVQFFSFALFMGVAMSITAFPVLARIVQERELQKTKLGTLAITCAAVDDITAWCILAIVIAVVKGGSVMSSLCIIGLAMLYVLLMIKVIKPFFNRVLSPQLNSPEPSKGSLVLVFIMLIISAYFTELIGIHALFGAFLAGVIMPEKVSFREKIMHKIEDVALILFLPVFFVFTGLRTEVGLLMDSSLLGVTALIIMVAVLGKFFGSVLAAKYVGQDWKTSLSIGALMNTRGLMELVVLNIGYDLGVLSPKVFTMMVIMALVTTLMTGPTLNGINYFFSPKK
jgi:Kef-type K+ transport system membrane component KefB